MTAAKFKLVSFSLCPYVQRARVVLNQKDIDYELEFIDLDAPPAWFFDISPLEKVPVLLVDDKAIFESSVICEYVDEVTPGSLHPVDPFEKAQNRSWMEFGNELLSNTYTYFTTEDELQCKQTRAVIMDRMDIIEEQIEQTPFFNGENFSIVDAVFAPLFRTLLSVQEFDKHNFFEDTPKVLAWCDSLMAHKSVVDSVPVTYSEEMATYIKRQNAAFQK